MKRKVMASFDDLPDELLLRVIEGTLEFDEQYPEPEPRDIFYGAESIQILYNLATVSKRLHRIVTPILYEHVNLRPAEQIPKSGYEPLVSFVITMLKTPSLADMVRSIMVHDPDSYFESEESRHSFTSPPLDTAVRTQLDVIFKDDAVKEKWLESLLKSQPSPEYLAVFATLCLPKLHLLTVNGMYTDEVFLESFTEVINACNQAKSNDGADKKDASQSVWQHLRHVVIQGTNDKYPDSTTPLAVFSRLKGLEILAASAVGDSEQEDGVPTAAFESLPPAESTVYDLAITPHSKLHLPNLFNLLRTPIALRSFSYGVGHAWAWVTFRTSEIQRAIDQQRQTLEVVDLSTDDFFPDDCQSGDDHVGMLDFTSYTKLKVLRIPGYFVFGQDDYEGSSEVVHSYELNTRLIKTVPISVEELQVNSINSVKAAKLVDAALVRLLDDKVEHYPRLRACELILVGGSHQEMEQAFVDSVAKAKSVQVGLAIHAAE